MTARGAFLSPRGATRPAVTAVCRGAMPLPYGRMTPSVRLAFGTIPVALLDAFVAGAVSQQLPLQRCGAVDRVVELLSPLPPESTAELIALATGLGAQSGRARLGMIRICPA